MIWGGGPLDISYVQSGCPVDFERDDVDLSIEAFPSPMPGTTSHKLIEFDLIPICSPYKVNGKPPPRNLADIVDYTLLCPGRTALPNPEHNLWQFWLSSAGIHEAYRLNCSYFSTFDLIFRAAVEGLGVGMGVKCFLEEELSKSALMVPFAFSAKVAMPYYLIVPDAKKDWPKVLAFREWITAKAQDEAIPLNVPMP
nr:LysR substrate-binding domain-containing protein [Sphingomonas sp. CDS-1]